MSDFAELLAGQIAEQRKSQPRPFSASDSETRRLIRKRQIATQNDLEPLPIPEEPPEEPDGGALWNEPKNAAELRELAKSIPPRQPPPPGTCLMDLIMAPEPKPLVPTLFTYFDTLVARGEV
jgi:hypothetical protein